MIWNRRRRVKNPDTGHTGLVGCSRRRARDDGFGRFDGVHPRSILDKPTQNQRSKNSRPNPVLPPKTTAILLLVPPQGRPSSWRPDGRRGRSSGKRPSAGCAGPGWVGREDGGSGWTLALPVGRREHPRGAERRSPQARAEIARAVRTGSLPLRPPGAHFGSGLKPRAPMAPVHRPRGAPGSCRNGTLQNYTSGHGPGAPPPPHPAGFLRRKGAVLRPRLRPSPPNPFAGPDRG
jgi:hypothetical protein